MVLTLGQARALARVLIVLFVGFAIANTDNVVDLLVRSIVALVFALLMILATVITAIVTVTAMAEEPTLAAMIEQANRPKQ